MAVDAGKLTSTVTAILCHEGIPKPDAAFVAESLIEADLRGVHSHGSNRLARYVRELRSRITNPAPTISILAEGPAYGRVDGDGALGPLVGRFSMDLCIQKARSAGSATVTACRSRHFGSAGFYCLRAAEQGLVGMAMTVASPRLAPTGGKRPLFGNNPLALAVPGDGEFPLVIDFAMGQLAAGKLELAAASNTPIPTGLARDLEGNPTTDPQVALKGTITPIGEHKGYGLTLFIELLAGLLSGSPYFGIDKDKVGDHVRDKGIGHFFMAIDTDRFLPVADFRAAVASMIAGIKESPRLDGTNEIMVPGEIEARCRKDRLVNGIPLPQSTMEMLTNLARECGHQF